MTYAFSYFSAPADQEAELWVGSQEDIIVYINGEVAHSFSGIHAFGDGDLVTDRLSINIKEGVNTVLVKTLNQFGDFSFCLNICEPESNPDWEEKRVEGLKFFTSKTGEVPLPLPVTIDPFSLHIWPNPANGPVHISFCLMDPVRMKIKVFNLQGKCVANIANETLTSGDHTFGWNPADDGISKAQEGIYFLTVEAECIHVSRKLIVGNQ